MARTLSPTLKSQQEQGLISWPYIQARITKKWGGVIRYDFEEIGVYKHILRPNAPGAETNILYQIPDSGEHWDKVDDVISDDDETVVLNSYVTQYQRDLYNITAPGDYGTISSIKVYYRYRLAGLGTALLKPAIKTGEVVAEGDEDSQVTPDIYKDGSYQWSLNPATGLAWTVEDLSDLQIGIALKVTSESGHSICTQVYVEVESDTSQEDDYLHTAAMPSDGSLVRLRVANPDTTKDLFYQRIENPGPESDFSAWTDLSIPNVIAIASAASGTNVSQFYVNTDGETYQRVSADSGENWGAWTLIHSYWTRDCLSLDTAYKPNGDICVVWPSQILKCEHADTGDNSEGVVQDNIYRGQSFSPEVNHYLDHVELKLWRLGEGPDATIYLYTADANGYPTGPVLAQYSFDTSTITTDTPGQWYSFPLYYSYLLADLKYCLVLNCPTPNGAHYLVWRYNDANPYARGHAIISDDYGETWEQRLDYDMMFREYGYHSKPGNPIALIYHEANGMAWELASMDIETPKPSTAMSVYYTDDWNIVGTYGGDGEVKGVATCILGDGESQPLDTWSAWESILERESTEPYNYHAPCVRRPDTTRLYFVESFTQEENLNHIWYSHMPPSADFDDIAWLEPVPTEPESLYGLAFTQAGSYAWLTNANKVYRALATEDALVITARLLEMDSRDYPDIFKGSLKVVLDNTGGWYNAFDRLGQQLEVGIGYITSAGNEYSLVPFRWITKFKLVAPPWYPLRMIYPTGVIGTLEIETEDAWRFLYRYRTRRTLSWEAGDKSVKELLQFFIARCGLDFDVISQSDAVQNFKPEFEVRTGTSYRTAIKNLLKMVPDQLVFREAKVLLRNPTTAEAVDWTYHSSFGVGQLLYRGRYGLTAWDPNRAEVWGDTFMKMAANWPQVQMVRDRLSRVTTPDYPNVTRAGERAEAELRKAEILTGEESWMQATTNCGLEPWDVLQITDLNAGVSTIRRRVLRIKAYWNAKHWAYSQIITLGAD